MGSSSDFSLTTEMIASYRKDGFVKLPGIFNQTEIEGFRRRAEAELHCSTNDYRDRMSRFKYGFDTNRSELYEVLAQPRFSEALSQITGRSLFLTFELCFELEKNSSPGFPWHVGTQSFVAQKIDDYGCSLWIPLDPVHAETNGGGMACVPKSVLSGRFIYDQIDAAVVSTLEKKAASGISSNMADYLNFKHGFLNSPAMEEVFQHHKVEHSFELGDAMLFDKYVVHKSVPLIGGDKPNRLAFVMRFMGTDSRYNSVGAHNRDYPVRAYNYQPLAKSPAQILLEDGDLLLDSGYFDEIEKRIIDGSKMNMEAV